jgi:hypothetical protein
MALPHEHCAPGDVCCTSLFEIADRILKVAYDAVTGCSVLDCELPELAGYVSMGEQIQDPVADYLVVSLTSVGPSARSADPSGNMQLPLYRANFQVKLLETGWPQPEGDEDEIIVPSPELVHNVTRHSYAHGEAMYRALGRALTGRRLNPCGDCFQRIEPLRPVEPSGGTTGWVTNIVMGMDW